LRLEFGFLSAFAARHSAASARRRRISAFRSAGNGNFNFTWLYMTLHSFTSPGVPRQGEADRIMAGQNHGLVWSALIGFDSLGFHRLIALVSFVLFFVASLPLAFLRISACIHSLRPMHF
jgi:hypothetical protein